MGINARFIGTELYCDDLERAREFYTRVLGLTASEEQPGHHAKFDSGAGFIYLERKGAESYPSQDKAVLFFAVPDLKSAVESIGAECIVQRGEKWAVLHDPEGHNVLLIQE
jgi:catechol 2,3-dioxygenase-like lactoylglutathione lyase family enzyme